MASAKDEVSRRTGTRVDPRADPDSNPTAADAPSPALREEVAPRAKKRDPRADPDSIRAMPAVVPDREAERPSTPEPPSPPVEAEPAPPAEAEPASPPVEAESPPVEAEAPAAAEKATAPADPRLAEIDRLLDRTAWGEIAEKLGPQDREAELPPALGLVYALARREAAGDEAAPGATALAIRSMAALLGVPPESAAALVLAKRLLRQNPATWRTRPAPRATVSVAIVVIGVALGIAAGSFLNLSAFKLW
jgi:hypothetical protein